MGLQTCQRRYPGLQYRELQRQKWEAPALSVSHMELRQKIQDGIKCKDAGRNNVKNNGRRQDEKLQNDSSNG